MPAGDGYKYKNKAAMRDGCVRQTGCSFKYWGPTWLCWEAFVGSLVNKMDSVLT